MDSEEDVDELTGYHSVRQGPAPIVLHSASKAEEAAVLAAHIKEWTQGEEDVSIGVLTRTNQRGEEIARQLGEHDVAVSAGRRTSTERPVAVMTMHNAKGLEFTHVILLDVNAEALPQRYLFKGLAPPKPTRRSSASVHCSTLRLHVPAICCWSAWWGGIGIVACVAHLLCPPWAMGCAAGQLEYSNCPYLQQAFTTQFMRQGGVDGGVAERMPDGL
ncbi:3'-5' exonuclease [Corynebacterium sp.]|uniref:3'-5' exonuclease n=1 Tax=Corynebacterium sp. TaxID=1720 RepID=UPI001E10A5F7|nr:3'-5' exonuclease [Corynebacterium sp.]MBS5997929.1 hypothetical protein [Corynebacterium sp.]